MPTRSHMSYQDLVVIDRRRTERIDADIYADTYCDGAYLTNSIIKNMSSEGMAISYCSDVELPEKFEIRSGLFEDTIPVRKVWSKDGISGLEVHM